MGKAEEFKGSGVFFTGKGVLRHGGVDYKNGQELPADIPAATIESLKNKGNASDARPVKPGRPAQDPRVAQLQATVQEMEKAAELGTAEITRLQGAVSDRDTRIADLEQTSLKREELIAELQGKLTATEETIKTQTGTIESLTAQITSPAPAEGGAGPKK